MSSTYPHPTDWTSMGLTVPDSKGPVKAVQLIVSEDPYSDDDREVVIINVHLNFKAWPAEKGTLGFGEFEWEQVFNWVVRHNLDFKRAIEAPISGFKKVDGSATVPSGTIKRPIMTNPKWNVIRV